MFLKLRFIIVGSAFFLLVTCLCAGQQAKPQDSPEQTKTEKPAAPAKVKVVDATPEDALRTFIVAVMARDEAALRAVTMPNADFEWLLKGIAAPPEVIKDATAQFAKQPMKRLKAGDTVALPRNRKMVVGADEVGEDKVILLPEGSPLPTRLQKVKAHWKVDASPFIAGRKAADAARKKAEAKKIPPPKKVAPNP